MWGSGSVLGIRITPLDKASSPFQTVLILDSSNCSVADSVTELAGAGLLAGAVAGAGEKAPAPGCCCLA